MTDLTSFLSKGLSSLLQHFWCSKASILQHSAFFAVHVSHLYVTTGKTIALTFVNKVMSLLLNMLSRLVIAFTPRSKCLLISWLQSPSAVILEPKKIKSVTVSTFSPIYLPWRDETGCHDLFLYNLKVHMFTWTFYDHFHYIKRLHLSADYLLILTFAFLLGLCNSPNFFRQCSTNGSLIFCLWKLENSAHFVSILEAISGNISPGQVFLELYIPLYLTASPAGWVLIMPCPLSKNYFLL